MSSPLLDSNVFVHTLTNDPNRDECAALMDALRSGVVSAELEIVVLHELTWVIPRYLRGIDKRQLVSILVGLIELPGIECDKALFADVLARWLEQPGISFADAYLSAKAIREGTSVLTKNVRDFRRQGVIVPDPLPS